MKLGIVNDIRDYDAKSGIVGFIYDKNYYTAYVVFTGVVRKIDPDTMFLLWIYSDDVKPVPNKLGKPNRISLVFPLMYQYKFNGVTTDIYEGKFSGASEVIGINDMDGIIDKNGNGFFFDENGAYIRFGNSKVVITDSDVRVIADKMNVPISTDRDRLLLENEMTILPSFVALPIPKDIVNFEMLSTIFGI